ncbi:unnamed protein product [Effrenium voratum]|nr:unnamed protein product [Effrenium voratum]
MYQFRLDIVNPAFQTTSNFWTMTLMETTLQSRSPPSTFGPSRSSSSRPTPRTPPPAATLATAWAPAWALPSRSP